MRVKHMYNVNTKLSGFAFNVLELNPLSHIYTLWLFTYSDIKTIIGPSFVFGAANALAGGKYGLKAPTSAYVIHRLPLTLLWIWMNLLPFTINNQMSPDAVVEDKINKPWRPFPMRRMTARQAERLIIALYPLAVLLGQMTGGLRQSVGLLFLGNWYNNFSGADAGFLVRNMINALGYVCFLSGAMEVAIGSALPIEIRLLRWFGMIAAIIFTTVHLQDMSDQVGDAMRGRKTLPLVLGDRAGRWTAAIPMLFWGYACPYFWDKGGAFLVLSLGLAGTVAGRTLSLTTAHSDRLTFKLWNFWVALIFVLPLFA